MSRLKRVLMLKDGEWVAWDGSDVSKLIIEEQVNLKELKEFSPEQYEKVKEELEILNNPN